MSIGFASRAFMTDRPPAALIPRAIALFTLFMLSTLVSAMPVMAATGPVAIVMRPGPPTVSVAPQSIIRWIGSLSDPVKIVRGYCSRKLILANDTALPALERSFQHAISGSEEQRRIGQIIAAIHLHNMFTDPRVSVQAHNAPLHRVLSVMCNELGLEAQFPYAMPHWPRVKIKVINRPFWRVLAKLNAATGAQLAFANTPPSFYFNSQFPDYQMVHHGAFALVLTAATRVPFYAHKPRAGPGRHPLLVKYIGFWIPQRQTGVAVYPPLVQGGRDNVGHRLRPLTNRRLDAFNAARGPAPQINFPGTIRLGGLALAATDISRLKLRLPVCISTDPRPIELRLGPKGAALTFNGIKIYFGRLKGQGPTLHMALHVRITSDPSSKAQQAFLAQLKQPLSHLLNFYTANAHLLSQLPFGADNSTGVYNTLTFGNNDSCRPASVNFVYYREVTWKMIPFTFARLPIQKR